MSTNTHHTIEIPELGITKYIPKELTYCDANEFRAISRLLYLWQSGVLSYSDFKVQAVYKILNLKKGKRRRNNIDISHAFSNIERISDLMDSFFEQSETEGKRIKLNIIENPVPKIRPIFSVINGPKARLTDTTFGQYEDASNVYQMYHRTQDVKYLWNLFTIYYQDPKRYQADQTEKRIKRIKPTTNFTDVFSFFLFFEAFQNYITSSKVLWEGRAIDLGILFTTDKNAPKSDLPGLGTKSLAFHISKTGIMGNLKETRTQNLWEVFLLLYDIRKTELDEAKQAKQQPA